MSSIQLIFPHQLFENTEFLRKESTIFLIEEWLFFRQYNFHKQKLVFHRATMLSYASYLNDKGFNVTYIDTNDKRNDIRFFFENLPEQVEEVFYYEPVDYWLEKRILAGLKKQNIKGFEIESLPNFINNRHDLSSFFRKDKKKFFQTSFYINERKRLNILVDENQEPIGGKWSFDSENRKKYPRKKVAPYVQFPVKNEIYKKAEKSIENDFQNNIGQVSTHFVYPTTFSEAKEWFQAFLEQRFHEFGTYEDAIVREETILNHSILSPLINTGLLSPEVIIEEAIQFAQENDVPINSLEGFVRQIIGWREFIRGMYDVKGREMRTTNFWQFKRKIPSSFYTGETGIPPVDETIKKVLATGYCHHIERLMILGNFMLLCEFDPDEVYQWFMELFIDSYDWVMVPNVYAMSQFADGGSMTTKPYFSSSNYIKKMSDYKNGDWCETWDALFWRFMNQHRAFLVKNPRLNMLVSTYDKMTSEKKKMLQEKSDDFLQKIDNELIKK